MFLAAGKWYEKSGAPPQTPRSTEPNAALAVAAPALHSPASVVVGRREQVRLIGSLIRILYHIPAQKVAEKGKENGDDTYPQARKNLVVQL